MFRSTWLSWITWLRTLQRTVIPDRTAVGQACDLTGQACEVVAGNFAAYDQAAGEVDAAVAGDFYA